LKTGQISGELNGEFFLEIFRYCSDNKTLAGYKTNPGIPKDKKNNELGQCLVPSFSVREQQILTLFGGW
jgi:hypothetical protein